MLDYGASIPLELLVDETFHPKVTVINKAEILGLKDHLCAGQDAGRAIEEYEGKCAIIASADLSHRLRKNSPGGYSPKGAKFDNRLIEYLNSPEEAANKIIGMDDNLVEAARSCGIKGIAFLMGALSKRKYEPEVLSYQTELGVGYLSFIFKLI
jgi:aromatic ring-opening dioxygenase LigB subunit